MTSSLRCASQLSCKVSISSWSSSFCSAVSPATHFSLSNLGAGVSAAAAAATAPLPLPAAAEPLATGFGAPKKDMILPSCLGFLLSADDSVPALRLRVDILVFVGKENGFLEKVVMRSAP